MILFSLLAAAQVAPTAIPERFSHTSYQRLDRSVSMRASARFILVRPNPTYHLEAVEKVLADQGWLVGLAGHWPNRQNLIELDLGESSNFGTLLALANALQSKGIIESYFPVWTRPPDGRTHVDDRVAVSLRAGHETKLMKRFGLVVVQRYPNLKTVISVRKPNELDAIALAAELHDSGAFEWAEPDWIFHPKATWDPSDRRSSVIPGISQAEGSQDRSMHLRPGCGEGSGVTVGVIDSGTQNDHPDLEVFAGYDLVDGDNDASPECIERADGRGRVDSCPSERPYRESHGTAVSGIVAARVTIWVAWGFVQSVVWSRSVWWVLPSAGSVMPMVCGG